MNYRRGLQRLYVVCSLVWVSFMVVVSVRDRPKPIDYVAVAKKYGATVITEPPETLPADFKDWDKPGQIKPPPGFILDEKPQNSLVADVKTSPLEYWGIRAGITVAPPIGGYLLLFSVIPWVYRGFKSGTHT